MNSIYLAHELLEWFNCPKKAFHIHRKGCSTLMQASHLLEQTRVLAAYTADRAQSAYTVTCINAENIEESIALTLEAIESKQQPRIMHGVLGHGNVAVYIPYMHWHNKAKGWQIHMPTSSSGGIRQEFMRYGVFISIVFRALNIPIYKIFLSYYHLSDHTNAVSWLDSDITSKIEKHGIKENNTYISLLNLLSSEHAADELYWQGCNKQYCDQCGVEKTHTIDDVRTLRKAKPLIEELLLQNIEKISEIPSELLPDNTIINRQIQTVLSSKPLLLIDEIENFIEQLAYPRYYLDFEAFSTSVPYDYAAPYAKKTWGYNPFLFSLQTQENAGGKIHTQLWSMIPGKNQLTQMWNTLKQSLIEANSIIVYGSQFEIEMIQQLATACNDNQVGDAIIAKIVDLQKVFFDLSIYHPEQKGKISLKTVTPIWLLGNYSTYRVNEGIAANYYFTKMTDDALKLLNDIKQVPYIAQLHAFIAEVEDPKVSLNDIAEYCKYDTIVMIQLVAMLERYIAKHNGA